MQHLIFWLEKHGVNKMLAFIIFIVCLLCLLFGIIIGAAIGGAGMSIVVRMEMPESCSKCRAWSICPVLNEYMSAGCYEWSFEDVLNMTDDEGFTKPEDCPIICQLPEGHGRLVDAEEMYKKSEAFCNQCRQGEHDCEKCNYIVAQGYMYKSHTIVPAERSET